MYHYSSEATLTKTTVTDNMSQSEAMLSLETKSSLGETAKTTAHLLPCRIHHDGPVEPAQPFWEPKVGDNGTSTAYFRGRRLQGKTVKLPDGYRGVVATTSLAEEQPRRPEEEEVIDLEAMMPQGTFKVEAEFDDVVVWGHEATADASVDPYLRGTEEWLALAEKIHSYPNTESKGK
ncbi:hypothetical protein VTK26DRAFT_7592 [Humicola hyalothermophila]